MMLSWFLNPHVPKEIARSHGYGSQLDLTNISSSAGHYVRLLVRSPLVAVRILAFVFRACILI